MLLPCNNLLSPLGRTRRAAAPAGVESEWCVSLDGNNDHVATGLTGGAYERTDSFSFSLWAYPTVAATRYLMSKATSAERGIEFLLRDGVRPEFNLISTWPSSGVMVTSTQSLTLNQWHHIAATYSGNSLASGIKIYIDGAEASGYSVGINNLTTTIANSEQVILGSFRGTILYLSGRLDDWRSYGRALSSTEVAALANNTSPPTDVTAYLPLETGTGTTTPVLDSTGATIATATLVGGATWSSDVPPALAP